MSITLTDNTGASRVFTIRSSDDDQTIFHERLTGKSPRFFPTLVIHKNTKDYNTVHSMRYTLKVPNIVVVDGEDVIQGYSNDSDNITFAADISEANRRGILAMSSSLKEAAVDGLSMLIPEVESFVQGEDL